MELTNPLIPVVLVLSLRHHLLLLISIFLLIPKAKVEETIPKEKIRKSKRKEKMLSQKTLEASLEAQILFDRVAQLIQKKRK